MSLEQTIGNLEIRYANVVTFVGSSNTMVDTTTGRIQTKGIQHNSNVITDVSGPHGRVAPTLKKYPEIAFESGKFDSNDSTNTYVQAGYTVTDSSHHNEYYGAWIFDDQTGFVTNKNLWISPINTYTTSGGAGTPTMTTSDARCTTVSGVATPGEWVQLKLPNKVKLSSISIMGPTGNGGTGSQDLGRAPKDAVLAGSVDGTTWNSVLTWSGVQPYVLKTYKSFPANVDSTNYYNYFRLIVTKNDGTHVYASIQELQLYGYEEDPPAGDHSVDTTFKSRFNNPQLTGVQVLVDGATGVGTNHISGGPDPSGNQATMTSPNKYWTLNGTLTSNLSVEANTFLEGDQPHAVSVWFNSSNLEANVSNTCVFSISDQEKLNSQNLDLQSNTWHNLTYAYQGEGGSKVTYLDGRKVAEDQAEDTFGEYPPFEMTGYSQGGYAASASSEYLSDVNALRNAYKVYNPTTDTAGVWMTEFSTFNPNAVGGDTFTDSDGGTHTGHWNKIELPYKLKPSYFYFKNSGTLTGSRNATNWVILGSNNDSEWDLLHSSTTVLNATKSIPITATKGYTYLMFLCKSVNADTALYMEEIRYYGHRENDLVRLPDPTNVLKYPHVALTGPAQRGYVVSASAEDSASSRYAWKAFNNILPADLSTDFWFSGSSRGAYTGGTSGREYVGSSNLGTDSGRTATVDGEWIQVQLPNKIQLTTFNIYGQPTTINNFPASGVLYARNETTEDWTSIYVYNDVTISTNHTQATHTPTTSTFYNTYALSITKKSNSVGGVSVGELELYGTEEDISIPIQIGGGNIDKVANFRVYDKFIGEDQVNEIWNAQKEEFGRAKPQMVLQQGKLGIGTDAPQGSLSVADEPHVPEEFPPRAMSGYKTYFEGHGEFCVSASDEFDTAGSYSPWKAFSKSTGALSFFITDHSPATYNTDGTPTAAAGTFEGVSGSWLKLKLPYDILLKSINLARRSDAAEHFSTALLYGSVDDVSWDVLHNIQMPTAYTNVDFEINATKVYKYFVIQITRGAGVTYQNIGEWKLFGTREQGQSVLHDGQLTLTKSLNVPRIGPALDADDTPRRDRLVVEYNTSTNPTFEGAVRDTSGRGNDGVFVGTASYNANEKALVFDGDSDYIQGNLANSGDFDFTVSCWLKRDTVSGNIEVWYLGSEIQNSGNTVGYGIGLQIQSGSSGIVYFFIIGGAEIQWNGGGSNFQAGAWNHIVCTRTGIDLKFYLNGADIGLGLDPSNGTDPLQLLPNSNFQIARRPGTPHYLDGSISNFKLYDTVLTAQEVKTLYDMGRLGNGLYPLHIDAPVHINGPLYAPGTILNITQSFYDGAMSTSSGSLQDVFSTEWVSMRKNSKVEVDLSVLYRNDGTGWGGMYLVAWFMVDVPVGSVAANTWVAYLTPGYHMTFYQEIPEYGNTSYLPFNIPTDFKIRFLLQMKPYNSGTTLYINRDHHLHFENASFANLKQFIPMATKRYEQGHPTLSNTYYNGHTGGTKFIIKEIAGL